MRFRFDQFQLHSNNESYIFGNVRTAKYNRTTFTLNGNFTTLVPINDDYSLVTTFYQTEGNEFRQLGSPMKYDKVCSSLSTKEGSMIYSVVTDYSNLPKLGNGDSCPIPAKFYHIDYFPAKAVNSPNLPPTIKNPKLTVDLYHFRDKILSFSLCFVNKD